MSRGSEILAHTGNRIAYHMDISHQMVLPPWTRMHAHIQGKDTMPCFGMWQLRNVPSYDSTAITRSDDVPPLALHAPPQMSTSLFLFLFLYRPLLLYRLHVRLDTVEMPLSPHSLRLRLCPDILHPQCDESHAGYTRGWDKTSGGRVPRPVAELPTLLPSNKVDRKHANMGEQALMMATSR